MASRDTSQSLLPQKEQLILKAKDSEWILWMTSVQSSQHWKLKSSDYWKDLIKRSSFHRQTLKRHNLIPETTKNLRSQRLFFFPFIHIVQADAVNGWVHRKIFYKPPHLLCWHSTQAAWVVLCSESFLPNTCITWHEKKPFSSSSFF